MSNDPWKNSNIFYSCWHFVKMFTVTYNLLKCYKRIYSKWQYLFAITLWEVELSNVYLFKFTYRCVFSKSNICDVANKVRVVVIFINHLHKHIHKGGAWWYPWISSSYGHVQPWCLLVIDSVWNNHLSCLLIQMNQFRYFGRS